MDTVLSATPNCTFGLNETPQNNDQHYLCLLLLKEPAVGVSAPRCFASPRPDRTFIHSNWMTNTVLWSVQLNPLEMISFISCWHRYWIKMFSSCEVKVLPIKERTYWFAIKPPPLKYEINRSLSARDTTWLGSLEEKSCAMSLSAASELSPSQGRYIILRLIHLLRLWGCNVKEVLRVGWKVDAGLHGGGAGGYDLKLPGCRARSELPNRAGVRSLSPATTAS